jgi:uncharacterized membrane protein
MSGTAISLGGYLILLVAGVVLELRGRAGTAATAGQALAAAMRTTPGRLAVFSVWIWLGVHFLAR